MVGQPGKVNRPPPKKGKGANKEVVLSDLELQRLANIADNEATLVSLGLRNPPAMKGSTNKGPTLYCVPQVIGRGH